VDLAVAELTLFIVCFVLWLAYPVLVFNTFLVDNAVAPRTIRFCSRAAAVTNKRRNLELFSRKQTSAVKFYIALNSFSAICCFLFWFDASGPGRTFFINIILPWGVYITSAMQILLWKCSLVTAGSKDSVFFFKLLLLIGVIPSLLIITGIRALYACTYFVIFLVFMNTHRIFLSTPESPAIFQETLILWFLGEQTW
jgi:hypothetical protein